MKMWVLLLLKGQFSILDGAVDFLLWQMKKSMLPLLLPPEFSLLIWLFLNCRSWWFTFCYVTMITFGSFSWVTLSYECYAASSFIHWLLVFCGKESHFLLPPVTCRCYILSCWGMFILYSCWRECLAVSVALGGISAWVSCSHCSFAFSCWILFLRNLSTTFFSSLRRISPHLCLKESFFIVEINHFLRTCHRVKHLH